MSEQRANPPASASGAGLALLAYGIFATHDAVIKSLGGSYSVFQIVFVAVLFAFVPVMLMLLLDRAPANLIPRHPWLVAARTLTMMSSMAFAFFAFTLLPLAETYALLFATPLLITVLSVPMLGETVRLRRWIAVFAGLIGVLVILRPGYTEFTAGHASALLAAAGSAISGILARKIGGEERSAVLILYPMLGNILVMGCALPWVYVPMPLDDFGLMASVGLLSTLAQLCVIGAFRAAPAALVAPFQYSQIIWAVPFGYFFFNDIPDIWVAAGTSIIVGSGLFVVWRENRAEVSETRPVLRIRNMRPDAGPQFRPQSDEPQ